MEYGAFFYRLAALLALLALGTWGLARHRFRSPVWRSRSLGAALALQGLLVPLLAAEGVFLFFVDITDGSMSTLSSRRWIERHLHRHVPQTFRGRLFASSAPAGNPPLQIAALGDSLTFGQGIEHDRNLYPSLLEQELRSRNLAADVFNISRPGWNTREELAELRRHFEAGEYFDIVVLGFCLNDIGSYVATPPGYFDAVARLEQPPAVLAPLVSRSFVASLLYTRYVMRTSPVLERAWKTMIEQYRSPAAFQPLARELEALKRLTDARGAMLVVLTFPDITGKWQEYPYRDIHRKLDTFWEQLGVTHVDLLAVFEQHPAETLHVSFLDEHPNELAHRLTAERLASALAKVLPPPGVADAPPSGLFERDGRQPPGAGSP